MDPKPPASLLPGFEGKARQRGGLQSAPALRQEHRQVREIGTFLGLQLAEAGAGCCWPPLEVMFGEQEIPIGIGTTPHRQAPGHMPAGGELAHREAVDADLHHRLPGTAGMDPVVGGQFNAGEQPVIEGNGHQAVLLPGFDLSQEACGVPSQDALNPAFGGAAAAPLPGDLHQHPVAVPGMVELVVANVDVLATVVPQGETEALAGAAKSGRHQIGMV